MGAHAPLQVRPISGVIADPKPDLRRQNGHLLSSRLSVCMPRVDIETVSTVQESLDTALEGPTAIGGLTSSNVKNKSHSPV